MPWPLFAQKYTHMNDSAHLLCQDLKAENKQTNKNKQIAIPALLISRPEGQTKHLFLGLTTKKKKRAKIIFFTLMQICDYVISNEPF